MGGDQGGGTVEATVVVALVAKTVVVEDKRGVVASVVGDRIMAGKELVLEAMSSKGSS